MLRVASDIKSGESQTLLQVSYWPERVSETAGSLRLVRDWIACTAPPPNVLRRSEERQLWPAFRRQESDACLAPVPGTARSVKSPDLAIGRRRITNKLVLDRHRRQARLQSRRI